MKSVETISEIVDPVTDDDEKKNDSITKKEETQTYQCQKARVSTKCLKLCRKKCT